MTSEATIEGVANFAIESAAWGARKYIEAHELVVLIGIVRPTS